MSGLRCEATGNPCGTDTWEASYQCPCAPCQQWLKDHHLVVKPVFWFIGTPSLEALRSLPSYYFDGRVVVPSKTTDRTSS